MKRYRCRNCGAVEEEHPLKQGLKRRTVFYPRDRETKLKRNIH